ncbi:MAG TPA: cytochrome P450 [Streptosporangiaceae bacterium]|nr:cytochrome P450 [Streptosporangiaceae bacterium]
MLTTAEFPGPRGGQRRHWRKSYQADPIGYLTRCREQYGDIFVLDDSLVVITDPTRVQRLLVRTNRESVPNPNLLEGGRLPDSDEVRAWTGVRELIGQALSDVAVRVPLWWPSMMRRRFNAARQVTDAELHALLDSPPEPPSPGQPPTLLHRIADADQLPVQIAMKAMGNALTSGIATMAGAWCWLLYHLGNRPDGLDRIRQEVASSESNPGADLPYTAAFIREVMRVHPPAWLLGRDTTIAVALDEHHTLPARTAVLFSPYLLHHDPRFWHEPDQFEPQRWLATCPPHSPYAYLPFGAGPRVCLGLHLSQLLLVRTAAQFATNFQLDLVHRPPTNPPRLATLLLPTGLTCTLTPDPAT